MNRNVSGTKKEVLAFRRADFIFTKVILGITVVAAVLFGLGGPVFATATDAPLPMSYTTNAASSLDLPRGATHDGRATVVLLLKDATISERLVQALPGLLIAAMTIAVAWLLFQLLRDTEAKEPFTRRNVRRINVIALIVGVGGLLGQLASAFADNAIYTTGRLPHLSFVPFEATFSPAPLFAMFVIALIGEVLRRGVELRHDVEGLV